MGLERTRMLMGSKGLNCREARQVSSSGTVFTLHTPVPAGFDLFDPNLMRHYFESYAAELKVPFDVFMGLGRGNPDNQNEPFNMATLAMKHASSCNGVSRLHGRVARQMLHPAWSEFPEHEVPVASVTNGIHIRSWISWDMAQLFDRYLGPKWMEDPTDLTAWERVGQIPDEELWRTHERRRERLVHFARRRLASQMEQRGAPEHERTTAMGVLDPEALTIGFARRFATYKRGTLLLRDPERLKRLLNNRERPVQFLMAGKAHPQDQAGKELIRQIVHFVREEGARRHFVFLEDYDIALARYLVQGVDVWLNTPRRPLEASGTSGMKVLPNGGLNLSILDGWWDEGYRPGTGWAIGNGEEYSDPEYQDDVESKALFDLLESEVVPLFYERGSDGLPRGWVTMMKNSMSRLCPAFNTNRMVHEYTEACYLPAKVRYRTMTEGGMDRVKSLITWKTKVRERWGDVRVEEVDGAVQESTPVGSPIRIRARVRLGSLEPSDVAVQIYHGLLDPDRRLSRGGIIEMAVQGREADGCHVYRGEIPSDNTGLHGYTIRVMPKHEDAIIPLELPLVVWE
jgi:starch phosphorylase